ncbi:MAG TPA: hypothetical protein VGB91_02030 [Rhizomicrobium sp.]
MPTTAIPDTEFVSPDDYPPLLPRSRRFQAMAMLKSSETLAKASRAIALRTAELRGAVIALVRALAEALAARDWPSVFAATHEIRGLAGTAGLGATGRIANVFCQYLDTVARFGHAPDEKVCALHLDALVLSARTEDDAARHGDAVAQELCALVARKLAELKDPAGD